MLYRGLAGEVFDGAGMSALPAATYTLSDLWGDSPTSLFGVGVKGGFGYNGRFCHYDGQSWSAQTSASAPIRALWGYSGKDVYAAGDLGYLYHFDGSAWTLVPTGVRKNFLKLWGASAAQLILAGEDGTIIRRK